MRGWSDEQSNEIFPEDTGTGVVSTGPRSEAGKKVASMNATKHGLTAKNRLSKQEEDQYQALLAGLVEEY